MPPIPEARENHPVPEPVMPHIPALDGLRGLAILLVLVHMLYLLETENGLPAYLFYRISYFGWTGVQLFFVLSGFLITGILLDTARARNYFSAFYARRVLRIFPLYFSVLAVAFMLLPAIGIVPATIAFDQPHQIWLWTYMSNWTHVFTESSKTFPHFWSLAVEEQFYLVWPLLIRSRSPEQCLRFCLGVAAISLALRSLLVWAGIPGHFIYDNSFCRMDALALGGAAASALRIPDWRTRLLALHQQFFAWSGMVFLAGLVITRGFWSGTPAGATIGYTIVAVSFTLLLVAIAGAEANRSSGWIAIFRLRPLRMIGKYSYAMYIFHEPLHNFAGRPIVAALQINVAQSIFWSAAYIVIMTAATFVVAWISWHVLEKPFLDLKRFFTPSFAVQPGLRAS